MNRVMNVDPKRRLYRTVASLAGLTMVAFGLRPILAGDLNYTNWFGGLAFAPLAILFGIAILLAAIFKPELLQAPKKNR
jgi:hypothetical protein